MENTSQSSKTTQTSTAWFELSFVAFDDRLKFDLLCKGIVMLTMIFMFTGVVMWFLYGILIDSVAVISANLVAGILQLIIIYFKLKLR